MEGRKLRGKLSVKNFQKNWKFSKKFLKNFNKFFSFPHRRLLPNVNLWTFPNSRITNNKSRIGNRTDMCALTNQIITRTTA